jgi:hypothetical protein
MQAKIVFFANLMCSAGIEGYTVITVPDQNGAEGDSDTYMEMYSMHVSEPPWQCCGSGIRVLFYPGSGIRNRFFPDPGSRIPDPKPVFLRA